MVNLFQLNPILSTKLKVPLTCPQSPVHFHFRFNYKPQTIITTKIMMIHLQEKKQKNKTKVCQRGTLTTFTCVQSGLDSGHLPHKNVQSKNE